MARSKKVVKAVKTETAVVEETPIKNDSQELAKAALEALTDEQRAAMLKELGFTQRGKKNTGPTPKELFQVAQEKLFAKMPDIQTIVTGCEFTTPFSLTVGVDHDGNFFTDVKRARKKYGPRKSE